MARVKVKKEVDVFGYREVHLDDELVARVAHRLDSRNKYCYRLLFMNGRYATFQYIGDLKAYVIEVGRDFFF